MVSKWEWWSTIFVVVLCSCPRANSLESRLAFVHSAHNRLASATALECAASDQGIPFHRCCSSALYTSCVESIHVSPIYQPKHLLLLNRCRRPTSSIGQLPVLSLSTMSVERVSSPSCAADPVDPRFSSILCGAGHPLHGGLLTIVMFLIPPRSTVTITPMSIDLTGATTAAVLLQDATSVHAQSHGTGSQELVVHRRTTPIDDPHLALPGIILVVTPWPRECSSRQISGNTHMATDQHDMNRTSTHQR